MNDLVEMTRNAILPGAKKPLIDLEARASIMELEASLREEIGNGDMPEVECPNKHYFSKGVYCREMFIPAGTCIVGKIHATGHINILSQGECTVLTQFGRETLKAPCTFHSEVGTQRAVFAHSDVIWTCVHPTDLTDVDEIEKEIIVKSYEELEMKLLEAGET